MDWEGEIVLYSYSLYFFFGLAVSYLQCDLERCEPKQSKHTGEKHHLWNTEQEQEQ